MPLNKKFFAVCIGLALLLCAAQILGNTMLIMLCLFLFLAFTVWSCTRDFSLPVILFFLPWSPLLRPSTEIFSFYTVSIIFVCAICIYKQHFRFKRYHILLSTFILLLSMISKFLGGHSLTASYIMFIMLLFLFPLVKEEQHAGKYDFYQLVVFLSAGAISAALCGKQFASYSNIAQYIVVDSYQTITRLSGFYGDPNFYTAQITAALGGCLVLILNVKEKQKVLLGAIIFLLLYCGFLSGSKSFLLVLAALVVLWIVNLFFVRGKISTKLLLLLSGLIIGIFIATSSLFSSLIDVFLTRFSNTNSLSDLTTHRTEIWMNYLRTMMTDPKLLLLGQGLTNFNINGRATHNTIIQIVYQLGLVGTPILAAWCIYFLCDSEKTNTPVQNNLLSILILSVGTFLPWFAIHMLFFDEFFLFQLYVFIGIQYLRCTNNSPKTDRQDMQKLSSKER